MLLMSSMMTTVLPTPAPPNAPTLPPFRDRKSTRLNSSHLVISYAVFCLKKKTDVTGSAFYVSTSNAYIQTTSNITDSIITTHMNSCNVMSRFTNPPSDDVFIGYNDSHED